MTGRELICYILENHLEDEPVVKNGKFIGFVTEEELAEICDVGAASIRAGIALGIFPSEDVVDVKGGRYLARIDRRNGKWY